VRVKGKDLAVPISEFVGKADAVSNAQRTALDRFAEGYRLYGEKKWDDAEAAFRQAAESGDAPSSIFVERCETFRNEPPPDDWDGSFTFTKK
jgi:adenylate cyclase